MEKISGKKTKKKDYKQAKTKRFSTSTVTSPSLDGA